MRDWERSWHYPRLDLARTYLAAMLNGTTTLALFAERRKGKTEFLIDDLQPLAQSRDIQTCYINFWRDQTSPERCVLAGVRKTLETHVPGHFSRPTKEIAVNLGIVTAKLASGDRPVLSDAIEALELLVSKHGRMLLMFDEIQHLATSSTFIPFTAALRTFLDSEKQHVRAIFTGSSRDHLDRLFRLQRAPFFNAASLIPFPDLDASFTAFLADRFQYLSGRALSKENLLDLFVVRGQSPAYISELLKFMLYIGTYDLVEAQSQFDRINPPDLDARQSWESANALERELLKIIELAPERSMYTAENYAVLSERLGIRVTKSAIQNALEKLRDQGLIWREGRGLWRIEAQPLSSLIRDIAP